jgi:hypothetical protein
LSFEGKTVATKGQHVFAAVASPSCRYIAVVSADGPLSGDLVSNFQFAKGTHYHEIWRRADGTVAAQPVVLPWTTKKQPGLKSCWSADERYIVYPDMSGVSLLIIETDLKEGD